MTAYQYLKTHDILESFFNDTQAITVTGVRDFAKEKGIVLSVQERVGISPLLSEIFLGVDSLRALARYVNIEPLSITGFVIRSRLDRPALLLEDSLYQVLDRWRDKILGRDNARLHCLSVDKSGQIAGRISYNRVALTVDVTSLDRVEESVDFSIFSLPRDHERWIAVVIQRKTRDFKIVLSAIEEILGRDPLSKWDIQLISTDTLARSEQRHTLLEQWIQAISGKYQILGSLEMSGKRDLCIETKDDFDATKDIRTATFMRLYPAQDILGKLRSEGAYTRGLRLVLQEGKALFEIWLKGKTDRTEISVLQGREVDRDSVICKSEDIQALPAIYLEDGRRIEIASDLWRLFCNAFEERVGDV